MDGPAQPVWCAAEGTDAPPSVAAMCLHRLIEARARLHPGRVAVVCGEERLTYAELDRRADRLAHHLRGRGVGPDVLVGLCAERSAKLVVALLGILKAGGAYMPLDPAYPRERLAFLLEDARPPVLVIEGRLRERLPRHDVEVVDLDSLRLSAGTPHPPALAAAVSPCHLAYVLYTSGSTGAPKGVQVPHGAVVNCLRAMQERPGLAERDVLLAVTTLSFDIAALELFLPLIVGARVVVARRECLADGRRLAAELQRSGATVLQATPATWRLLLEAGWQGGPHLKALCGGEALPPDLAARLLPRCGSLWNLYGPTETTIWATVQRVESAAGRVPIGRPIANTEAHILDAGRCPLPDGTAGELYLGGAGLARGYLRRPDLTADRFVPHPFRPGARLYRTGDLACRRPDGTLDYLGRLDDQVKIDGHRIEPGEVEAALAAHPGVRAAVVVAREDTAGRKRLAAYVVPRRPAPSAPELRRFLGERLPRPMVPAIFTELDALPLTPTGKVDRRALPAPAPATAADRLAAPPRNELEARLLRLWEEVLGARPVGVQDDFFELGGDSLQAVRLLLLIQKELGRELSPSALQQGATVERLAALLAPHRPRAAASALVAIRPHGSRPPLFLVHGIGGSAFGYTPLARLLGDGQPVYGFQAQGLQDGGGPLDRVEAMAERYLAELLAVRPHGPYHLGGYSFGALVAFEMAQRLRACGKEVGLLAVLDEECPLVRGRPVWAPAVLARWLCEAPGRLRHYLRGHSLGDLFAHAGRVAGKLFGRPAGGASFAEVYRESEVPESCRAVWEANFRAERDYVPRPYPGRITVFRARVQPLFSLGDAALGWGRLAGSGIDVVSVPGDHISMVKEPHLAVLAERLRELLERGPAAAPRRAA